MPPPARSQRHRSDALLSRILRDVRPRLFFDDVVDGRTSYRIGCRKLAYRLSASRIRAPDTADIGVSELCLSSVFPPHNPMRHGRGAISVAKGARLRVQAKGVAVASSKAPFPGSLVYLVFLGTENYVCGVDTQRAVTGMECEAF